MSSPFPPPFDSGLKVLVLAGSNPVSRRQRRRQRQLARRGIAEIPLENKAFLPLRGRVVLEYVLEWLNRCGLHRVWVLADADAFKRLPPELAYHRLAQRPGASLFANLSMAYTAIAPADEEPVLVIFGDHPINSPAALGAFLAGCAEHLDSADYFHAVSRSEAYKEFAPWFKRTSGNLREFRGRASGLNLAIPSRLHRLKVLDQMYAVRKQEQIGAFLQLLGHLVRWLGWRSLPALVDCSILWLAKEAEKHEQRFWPVSAIAAAARYYLSRLVPAARMEGHLARILEAERGVRLIPVAHGGIALDVDFAEELQRLENHWDEIQAVADRQNRALSGAQPTSMESRYEVR